MKTEDRFWPKVDRRGYDECWPWLACTLKPEPGRRILPYGRFRLSAGELGVEKSTQALAHRVAFRLIHGHWPYPQGLHGCDDPGCCNALNPAHVHEGDQALNIAEMLARGRARCGPPLRGAAHPEASLTDSQAVEIRARASESPGVLALEFGVSWRTVARVLNNQTYRTG